MSTLRVNRIEPRTGDTVEVYGQLTASQPDAGNNALAIGGDTGLTNQGARSVAIGFGAGVANQGIQGVAVGLNSGANDQSDNSVAIGTYAGETTQAHASIAIGAHAGRTTQGTNSVAIGVYAGMDSQGISSVAIGDRAGKTYQANNSIIISSTGGAVDTSTPGSITIKSTTTELRSLPDGGFAMNNDPIIGARSLIKTLSTLRKATMDETTLEGLRDSIGNAIGGLIENLEHEIATMPAEE